MSITRKITIFFSSFILESMLCSCASKKDVVRSRFFKNDSLQIKVVTKLKNDTIRFSFYTLERKTILNNTISGYLLFDFGNNYTELAPLQRWNDSVALAIQNNWWNYFTSELVYRFNGAKHSLRLTRENEEEEILLAPWRKFL